MASIVLRSGLAATSRSLRASPKLNALGATSPRSHGQLRHLMQTARVLAANPQAGAPTSKNVQHAYENAKQEASKVASSLGSAISGNPDSMSESKSSGGPAGMKELLDDAKSITGELAKEVPQPALLWGAAGIIPYISTSTASIYLARQLNLVATGVDNSMDFDTAQALLIHAQNLQLTYGAVILSFLGALHWGFEFSKYGGAVGNRRYAIGVFPVLLAWPSLLFTPQIGLIMQWATYVGIWFFDLRATNKGWVPSWYSTYRFWLTVCVGSSIIATLAGTNYYQAHEMRSDRKQQLMEHVKSDAETKQELIRRSASGDKAGVKTEVAGLGGEVLSQSQGEEGDSYVVVRNPKKEEEERRQKEEEQKKKEKEQQEKKQKQDNKADTKNEDKRAE